MTKLIINIWSAKAEGYVEEKGRSAIANRIDIHIKVVYGKSVYKSVISMAESGFSLGNTLRAISARLPTLTSIMDWKKRK